MSRKQTQLVGWTSSFQRPTRNLIGPGVGLVNKLIGCFLQKESENVLYFQLAFSHTLFNEEEKPEWSSKEDCCLLIDSQSLSITSRWKKKQVSSVPGIKTWSSSQATSKAWTGRWTTLPRNQREKPPNRSPEFLPFSSFASSLIPALPVLSSPSWQHWVTECHLKSLWTKTTFQPNRRNANGLMTCGFVSHSKLSSCQQWGTV